MNIIYLFVIILLLDLNIISFLYNDLNWFLLIYLFLISILSLFSFLCDSILFKTILYSIC